MRRRITWLTFATTATVVLGFIIPLCLMVQTLAEYRAMNVAEQEARAASAAVGALHADVRLAGLINDIDSRGIAETSVVDPQDQVFGSRIELTSDDVTRGRQGIAYSVVRSNGGFVVVPVVVPDEGTYVVVSSVTTQELNEGVGVAWAGLIGLGAAIIGLALVVATQMARRISEPLREVATVAHTLRRGDLSARASVGGPAETVELAKALNGLAERTTALLAAERLAVGELAHRLRTPMTALRLDVETVPDPDLAGRLQSHVVAVQKSIDGIVREAQRPVRDDLPVGTNLSLIVTERIDYWSALADDQGRQVTTHVPSTPVRVDVSAADLRDMVDICLDNVFAHTDEGVGYSIRLSTNGSQAFVEVADSGPGFPVSPSETRVGSTGLGLGIVRRATQRAGGDMTTSEPGVPGAQIRITLPLSASSSPT